jgi:hypothetical protein
MRCIEISLTVVLLISSIFAQTKAQSAQGVSISDETALSVVRVLNTAEAIYYGENRSYATLDQLIRSGAIDKARSRFTRMDPSLPAPEITGPEVWNNYKMQLSVNNAGRDYVLLLKSTQSGNFTFVSDAAGVIYRASPVQ